MPLINTRVQWAVGQGFFHSAALIEDDELRLRYVYDCGAKALYEEARSNRVDELVVSVGRGERLDLLFLSHVHEDHVNGVEQLLDGTTGLQVDTIVLPLLGVEDRLIAFARSVSEDPAAAGNGFYRDLVADPIGTLSRFNPRQILLVRSGGPDGGAPGSDDRPVGRPDGGGEISGLRDDKGRASWKLVGRGDVQQVAATQLGASADTAARVAVIDDSLALATSSRDDAHLWLFAPFVDPLVEDARDEFLEALADSLKMSIGSLQVWLKDVVNVEDLVVNHVGKLKSAYTVITANLNITTMSLYSGPERPMGDEARWQRARFGKWVVQGGEDVAWLGTGDAALKQKSRRTAFLDHYDLLLRQVITLTMPHHGSDHNFHVELLDRIEPSFCIAAADKFLDWKHPGPHAAQSVASTGRFLSVVTSNPLSTVVETVRIG
ncbi:MAG: hypothetical protein JOZ90_16655 [Alphaproteobacteria bacterium]|nr:hypothetical protein [Alphaproteobacteria bacterium]MBV9371557.1 hypothetical protein [Alphaproteobacteria bacterium]MBV9902701.1 hypothetical protein [Alphaproteobacteria bacterium]